MRTPNHLDDTAISNLVDRGMLPATNAETILGNQLRKAVAAFIDPALTHADLKARLEMGGLECFSSYGGIYIRTVEAGNRHRELVRAERQTNIESAERHRKAVAAEVAEHHCSRNGECLLGPDHKGDCEIVPYDLYDDPNEQHGYEQ